MENRYCITLCSLICFTSPAIALNDELISDGDVTEPSHSCTNRQVPAENLMLKYAIRVLSLCLSFDVKSTKYSGL